MVRVPGVSGATMGRGGSPKCDEPFDNRHRTAMPMKNARVRPEYDNCVDNHSRCPDDARAGGCSVPRRSQDRDAVGSRRTARIGAYAGWPSPVPSERGHDPAGVVDHGRPSAQRLTRPTRWPGDSRRRAPGPPPLIAELSAQSNADDSRTGIGPNQPRSTGLSSEGGRCDVIYLLALIAAVAIAVLLWRAFGPQRGAPPVRRPGPKGPDDDPDFLWRLDRQAKKSRDEDQSGRETE